MLELCNIKNCHIFDCLNFYVFHNDLNNKTYQRNTANQTGRRSGQNLFLWTISTTYIWKDKYITENWIKPELSRIYFCVSIDPLVLTIHFWKGDSTLKCAPPSFEIFKNICNFLRTFILSRLVTREASFTQRFSY